MGALLIGLKLATMVCLTLSGSAFAGLEDCEKRLRDLEDYFSRTDILEEQIKAAEKVGGALRQVRLEYEGLIHQTHFGGDRASRFERYANVEERLKKLETKVQGLSADSQARRAAVERPDVPRAAAGAAPPPPSSGSGLSRKLENALLAKMKESGISFDLKDARQAVGGKGELEEIASLVSSSKKSSKKTSAEVRVYLRALESRITEYKRLVQQDVNPALVRINHRFNRKDPQPIANTDGARWGGNFKVQSGEAGSKFPGLLPLYPQDYYKEYRATADFRDLRRIVVGKRGEVYYSVSHYGEKALTELGRAPDGRIMKLSEAKAGENLTPLNPDVDSHWSTIYGGPDHPSLPVGYRFPGLFH